MPSLFQIQPTARAAGLAGCRVAGLPGRRATGLPGCRAAGLLGRRAAGVPGCWARAAGLAGWGRAVFCLSFGTMEKGFCRIEAGSDGGVNPETVLERFPRTGCGPVQLTAASCQTGLQNHRISLSSRNV